jgi:hypothetical protein
VVDAAGGQQAVVPASQVADLELVGVDRGELGILAVDAANPIAALFEIGDQVVADEAAGAGHEHALVGVCHFACHSRTKPPGPGDEPVNCRTFGRDRSKGR